MPQATPTPPTIICSSWEEAAALTPQQGVHVKIIKDGELLGAFWWGQYWNPFTGTWQWGRW